MKKIVSLDNKTIKQVISLKKSRERKNQNKFYIDGLREIEIALNNNYIFNKLFFCPTLNKKNIKYLIDKIKNNTEIIEVDERVFKKISYKENPDGVLAILDYKKNNENNFNDDIVFVLDNIEKPGNFGAICRTAVAANVNNIFLTGKEIDIFNPNVIKSSEGLIFNLNIEYIQKEDLVQKLKNNNYKVIGALTNGSVSYASLDYKEKIAIVLGSESKGLDLEWNNLLDEKIKIPMKKNIDSLNLSVSAAIIVYEILRQNNFKQLN